MNGFGHHLAYDFRSGFRDTTLMLMNYLFPIGFFLIIGLFMPSINPGFLELMVPGLIIFGIMAGTLMTIPSTLIDQRQAAILRSFRVNGVPAGALITIPVLGALFHMTLTSAVITAAGGALFGARLPSNWFWFIVTFLLTVLCHASLAVLIGTAAPSSRAGTLLSQLVYLPSVLLGGIMVPEVLLPPAISRGASLLPAAQAMRMFNALAFGTAEWSRSAVLAVIILPAGIVLNLALSFLIFQWDRKQAGPRVYLALLSLLPFAAGVFLH